MRVEFEAPHKLTVPALAAGLHEMDLARNVIDQEGDTFKLHTTRLVAAVVTQIFSYMIDSGVSYGYICTGEAFVFLHVPNDLTVVKYSLCVQSRRAGGRRVPSPPDCRRSGTCIQPSSASRQGRVSRMA
jgi:hypothetical protein